MARGPKLKVYRMAVGFHDAYVAAPSQKAAAEAWGSDASVFSRGEAELVTDAALTQEPLAKAGEVIKRLRGTAAEQIAALGGDEAEAPPVADRPAKKPLPKPRPSRSALEKAEQDIGSAKTRYSEERAELARREAELERERKALEAKQRTEMERLEARLEAAEASYDEAVRRWRLNQG
jgi:vacuolar-type H+-ATPase subunit I/STV1